MIVSPYPIQIGCEYEKTGLQGSLYTACRLYLCAFVSTCNRTP